MASESVRLQASAALTATETRSASDVPTASNASGRKVVHNAYNQSATLHASSTPAVNRVAFREITLAGSIVTIDLTAAQTVNGTEDLTGKKVVGCIMSTGAANVAAVNVAPGASNPYPLYGAGNDIDLAKNRTEMFFFREGVATQLPAVSGTVKTIDVSGTSGDTLEIMLILG